MNLTVVFVKLDLELSAKGAASHHGRPFYLWSWNAATWDWVLLFENVEIGLNDRSEGRNVVQRMWFLALSFPQPKILAYLILQPPI